MGQPNLMKKYPSSRPFAESVFLKSVAPPLLSHRLALKVLAKPIAFNPPRSRPLLCTIHHLINFTLASVENVPAVPAVLDKGHKSKRTRRAGHRRFRVGRVEDGRGCLGPMANAPFPIPAHRTGRADFRHPALRLVSP